MPSKVPAEDTAAAVTDRNWKVPRTSWGDPNLEGIYSTDDMRSVPRERPEELGTREKLTPEEFAERAKADAETRDRILNRSSYSSNSTGSRTFGWTSQVIDPPNGRMPEMNETGKARARPNDRGTYGAGPFDTFEDFHLYDRCMTRGILGSAFSVSYGNGMRIAQSPDSVVISYEMLTDSRVIPLDGRDHAPDSVAKQYMGNSRGHWEGDTLVIETRNFNGKTAVGGNGIGVAATGDRMTMTERLTRVDPSMIEYVATVNDPLTYYSAVHRADDVDQPARLRDLRVLLPRTEPSDQRRTGRRAQLQKRVQAAIARGETPPERLPSQPNLAPLPEDDSVFINVNEGEAGEPGNAR